MSKHLLQLETEATPRTLNVEPQDTGSFKITLKDKTYLLNWHFQGHHGAWVHCETTGEVLPCYFYKKEDQLHLWLQGQVYGFSLLSSNTPRRAGPTAAVSPEIRSPMPGTLLKILVSIGDSVVANTPLMIMESMKMEVTITAPAPARVKSIVPHVGDLVEMQSLLMTLELTQAEDI